MRYLLVLGLLVMASLTQAATVVVLGDSISAGYGIDKTQGWVSLLAQKLSGKCADMTVKNASVSGETSAGGLTRLPTILSEDKPAVLVIELGGNDGLRGLSPQVMQQNLAQMIDLARAAGADVVLLGMRMPANLGEAYRRLYDDAFKRVATSKSVPLLPFFLDRVYDQPGYLQADRIHPTEIAQPQLLDNAWTVIGKPLGKLCPALVEKP